MTRDELLAKIEHKDEYHSLKVKTVIGRYVRVGLSDLRAFLSQSGMDRYAYKVSVIASVLAHHISWCIDAE